MAPTPIRPSSSPASPVLLTWRSRPVTTAITVPTSGTPATRSPASELVTCCSAHPRSTHGPAISTAANATTQPNRSTAGRRSTRVSAMGRSTAAPIVVRANTSTGGDTSATATRIRSQRDCGAAGA